MFNQLLDDDSSTRHARKLSTLYAGVAWAVLVSCFLITTYGSVFTDGDNDFYLAPFQSHIVVSNPLIPRIVMCFVVFYVLAVYTFSLATTFVLALIFSRQFKKVNEALKRLLDNDQRQVSETAIEMLRQKHQQIAMNVSNVDDCLMFSNASAFCCQVFCVIIFLYCLVFYCPTISDPVTITGSIILMIIVSVGLLLTAAGGIIIHHYVSI